MQTLLMIDTAGSYCNGTFEVKYIPCAKDESGKVTRCGVISVGSDFSTQLLNISCNVRFNVQEANSSHVMTLWPAIEREIQNMLIDYCDKDEVQSLSIITHSMIKKLYNGI